MNITVNINFGATIKSKVSINSRINVDDDIDEVAEVQTNVVPSQNYFVVYAIYVYCSINFE